MILRLWKPWRVAWRITVLNINAAMQERSEFLFALLLGVIWQASILIFATVLLTRFPGLGGWTSGGVLLIAAMRLLSHGLYLFVFPNVSQLTRIAQEGRIDGFLLRPLPVYRQVLLSRFPLNAVGDTTVAFVLFGIALDKLDVAWTPTKVFYLAAGVLGGMLVEAAIQTVLSSAAFRFTGIEAWTTWFDEFLSTFGNYPLRILPGFLSGMMTFVVPVAFIGYFPAAVVLGMTPTLGVPTWLAYLSPAVGAALFVASRLWWNFALRFYQGI